VKRLLKPSVLLGSAVLLLSVVLAVINGVALAAVAGCGCYCGVVLRPPCSDAACKHACGWTAPTPDGAPPQPSYDDEAERQRQEAELRRQNEERQRQEAEAAKRRQVEFERNKQEALQNMKGVAGELGLKGLDTGEAFGLKGLDTTGSGGLGFKEIGGAGTGLQGGSRRIVQAEQDEFDTENAAWRKRQEELIRQAVAQDTQWKNEVLASIKAIRVPSPIFRPKALEDAHPGDILLVTPDDSLIAQTIATADPLYRAIDYFSLGDVSAPDFQTGRASHALTVVKAVNGEILFLDHTKEGSRILNKEDYLRKYGGRAIYVARPQAVVDGRELWDVARDAALQKASDYGLFGSNVVCSERAAIAVAKATQLPLQTEGHRLGGYLGPVDITPNDFFDREHVGKYFVISAAPIVPPRRNP